jgi:hypothetical protein
MAESDKDDPTIPDDEPLWRRIPKEHLIPDENIRGIRISSAAFSNDSGGQVMSVMLASMMATHGCGTEKALVGHATFGLAVISAKDARDRKQVIVREPLDGEPAHAVVAGKKSPSTRKALTAAARWLVPPPGSVILGLDRLPPAMVVGVTEQTAWKLLVPPLESAPVVAPPPAAPALSLPNGPVVAAINCALRFVKRGRLLLTSLARRLTTRR